MWLCGLLRPAASTSGNLKPAEPDVVHDHIRLRQHQVAAITCISVRIRTRHREQAGQTDVAETVGGSSCSIQLSPGGGSIEMISDRCLDANGKVLVKRIGDRSRLSSFPGGPRTLSRSERTRSARKPQCCGLPRTRLAGS